jgi:MFS family permease
METDLKAPVAAVSPNYKWWVVFMLWFICLFNYADRQAIFSVFPVLEKEFGFSKTQLGLIASAFAWVYAGAAPVAGFIGDRLRRKGLILGGFLFWSIVTMATGWSQKFWQFFAVRATEGFGEAFYFPASMSLISDYHGGRTRSRAMSIHQSSVYIGTIGGGVLGGFFAEKYGWRAGFYFFGLAGIALALVLSRFLREPRRGQSEMETPPPVAGESPSVPEVIRAIFRTPTALVLMLVFVGANFVALTFLTWMPTYLGEKFGLKLTLAGLAGTVFIQLASAIGSPVGGALADVLSRKFPGGRIAVQAAGLAIGSVFVFFTGMTRDVGALMLVMTIFGFCKGLYDANIFASLYDVVHPRARATAAGVMNAVGWAGGALAPTIIGWLLTRGGRENEVANMSLAIACGGAIYLAGAALLLVAALCFARRDVVQRWDRVT